MKPAAWIIAGQFLTADGPDSKIAFWHKFLRCKASERSNYGPAWQPYLISDPLSTISSTAVVVRSSKHVRNLTTTLSSTHGMSGFLRATAGTAIARLSHRNSVCPSVCPSVTRVDQAKTVQAMIIKSSPSAATKTLVSGSVTLFQKIHRGHPNRGR